MHFRDSVLFILENSVHVSIYPTITQETPSQVTFALVYTVHTYRYSPHTS